VIPHYIVLLFLWVAFFVLTVVAFFAIALTGRYPQSLFEFNVGVLRWTWRVDYYAYGALGTDRYPPFTLADVEDYPARLFVPYPARLSRGLVWVKWWLLAMPHYLVLSIFVGGGVWASWQFEDSDFFWLGGGLIGLLVCFAAIVLLFRGRYPRSIFDMVLGMNRWALRVTAYSALMTDTYPPFRLDMGGDDPGSARAAEPGPSPKPGRTAPAEPSGAPTTSRGGGWTGGRILAVVIGVLMVLASLGLLAGATAALVADQVLRDDDGFVTSPEQSLATTSYALTSDPVELHDADGPDALYAERLIGDVRLQVTAADPAVDIFVGVAPSSEAAAYLGGVEYAVVRDISNGEALYAIRPGSRAPAPPTEQGFWVAATHGAGTQLLDWQLDTGDWTVVVMNSAATPGLDVEVDIGATIPVLDDLVWILGLTGIVVLALGVTLIYLGASRVGRTQPAGLPSRHMLPPPQPMSPPGQSGPSTPAGPPHPPGRP
jgi:hypothetical protein